MIDQATRRRHARTQAPRKPRTAPTQMKTVPSGKLDFCMNGAPLVSGTMREGMDVTTPAIVGALERSPVTTVVDAPTVGASEMRPVTVTGVVVDSCVVAVVGVVAVVSVTVERFGRSVGVV